MYFPFPGSPGVATMGVISAASSSMTSAYCASSSLHKPSIMSSAFLRSTPRRSTRNSITFSSGATIPVNPPISAAIFVIVARSSTLSSSMPSPAYSMTFATSLPLREIFLLELELRGQIKQAELLLLFVYDFIQERQVIAEEQDRRRIVYLGIFADVVLEEDRRHRSDIFMAEPQVGHGETGITGLHCCDAHFAILVQQVAGKDFLGQRHWTCGAGALARSLDRGQKNFLMHARHVEREKPAVLDHLASNLIFTGRELTQRNLFSGANLIDQRKVCRRQHAEVLAILLVDTFDILRNHQLDAC